MVNFIEEIFYQKLRAIITHRNNYGFIFNGLERTH